MAPEVLETAWVTPLEPVAPWPPAPGHCLFAGWANASGAVLFRYCEKLNDVPEESERWNAWIFSGASALPPLSAAIAGSDQSVILPSKMPPRVLADRFRVGAF